MAFGVPPEEASRWKSREEERPRSFEILPPNWAAARLFLAASTQWRTAGMAGAAIGLDYNAAAIVARALEMELDEDTLIRLQAIELEAVRALHERSPGSG